MGLLNTPKMNAFWREQEDRRAESRDFTKRRGSFAIPNQWARQGKTEVKRVMGACVIVRAECMFVSDRIEYLAFSEHFREISDGEEAPRYEWRFSDDGGMTCHEITQ